VAKHNDLDVAAQIVGRVGKQPDERAQQEIHESEEHGGTSHEKEGRSYEPGHGERSALCVPFTLVGRVPVAAVRLIKTIDARPR